MATTVDYYANFTMTRSAGLGDKVCVRVKTAPTFVEICSFDLEEPLPVLVWSFRENDRVLSMPKDVEYRRITVELTAAAVASSRIDLHRHVLEGMLHEMGLPR